MKGGGGLGVGGEGRGTGHTAVHLVGPVGPFEGTSDSSPFPAALREEGPMVRLGSTQRPLPGLVSADFS